MKCMCGNEVNLLNYLLTNYLIDQFNFEELNIIGNFLQLVGQTLITISEQNEYCQNIQERKKN